MQIKFSYLLSVIFESSDTYIFHKIKTQNCRLEYADNGGQEHGSWGRSWMKYVGGERREACSGRARHKPNQ